MAVMALGAVTLHLNPQNLHPKPFSCTQIGIGILKCSPKFGQASLDEILSFFGGRGQPMMAELAEAGKLTLDDVRELEKTIKKLELEHKQKGRMNRNDR